MDTVDVLLLRDLTWDPREPSAAAGPLTLWRIARHLGIHGRTARRRVDDLRDAGALTGIHLVPAPSVVGRAVSRHLVHFPDANAKRAGMRSLLDDRHVWELEGLLGSEARILLAMEPDEDESEAIVKLAASAGADRTRKLEVENWPVPADGIGPVDLHLMAALAPDALRSTRSIAHEVGLSVGTVAERLTFLAAQGAFLVQPAVDFSLIHGAVFFEIEIVFDKATRERVIGEATNRWPLGTMRTRGREDRAGIVLAASRPAAIEEELGRAQTIPGVRSAAAHVLHSSEARPERWQDALRERAAFWDVKR